MANTVIGLFDSATEAQQAIQALINQGFDRDRIDISANNTSTATDSTSTSTYNNADAGDRVGGFFSSLFGSDNDDYNNYSEVARRGSSIVTVHAETPQQAQTAAQILDQYNAIDVDSRAAEFRGQTNTAATTNTATTNTTARAEGDVSIPVVEEQLQVGKQVVETGGARLRSRIIERPVEESVRLREEHVHVERHAVNRPATEADFKNFSEGEIEITERAEVPVVGKQAQVVEEVSLGKETTERTETIRDTVRKTDVEVEEINGDVDNQTRTART